MKAILGSRIVEIIVDESAMNVVLLGRDFEKQITREHAPIKTFDRAPDPRQDSNAVFAWSDTYKGFVIAPSKVVGDYPKLFTHWLPRSVIPDYQKVTA
jgi:hypothetical protein